MASIIAKNYAIALFEIAEKAQTVKTLLEELDTVVAGTFGDDVREYFLSRTIEQEKKKNMLTRLFDGKIDRYFYNMLMLLVDAHRFLILPSIRDEFVRLYQAKNNIREARIITAFALSDTERDTIVAALGKRLSCGINAVIIVRPELIGGIVIEVDGTQYDYSVAGQLASMKERILKKNLELGNYYED
ncbi:MAG: ATP synthase F1 subunit delta [Spirochaetes bacterium]|nr:ATP synthase F1 subunit delta [Spirochaetota bacterium]